MELPDGRPVTVADPAVYYDDALLMTRTHVWTYVEVPTVAFSMLPDRERIALVRLATLSLAAVRVGDVQIKTWWEARPVGVWARERDERVRAQARPASSWPGWLRREQVASAVGQPLVKRTVLGVNLGRRSLAGQGRSKGAAGPLAPLSGRELAAWTVKAERVRRLLCDGGLEAVPLDAAGMTGLRSQAVRQTADTTVTGRTSWGPGGLQDQFDGVQLAPTGLGVRISGPDGDRLVATAVVAAFPMDMLFPRVSPWLHWLDRLQPSFPVESDLRFTLRKPQRAKADVIRRLRLAADQASQAARAGIDLPYEVEQVRTMARDLEWRIPQERLPLAYGWARLRFDAGSQAELDSRYEELSAHMARLGKVGLDLRRPGGQAQLDLLAEGLPGGPVRHKAFLQRWMLQTVAGALPHAGSNLGDTVSAYRGWTTGRTKSPVHWSPLWAISGTDRAGRPLNKPPVWVALGDSGAGKSSAMTSVLASNTVEGIVGVHVDPSGPQGEHLPGVADLAGLVEVVNVTEMGGGSLDALSNRLIPDPPLMPGDPDGYAKARARVRTARERLCREQLHLLAWRQIGARPECETEMLRAIGAVAAGEHGVPASWKVIAVLADGNEPARFLAEHLRYATAGPDAQAAFGADDSSDGPSDVRVEKTLTIMTMPGIALPEPGSPMDRWTPSEQLGAAQMTAVVAKARRLLYDLPWSVPKSLTADEAQVPLGTPAGMREFRTAAADGRKRFLSVGLATHTAQTIADERLRAQLSTVFQFRNTSRADVHAGLELLNIDPTAHHRELIPQLANGECLALMPDGVRDRFVWARWNEQLRAAQDTSPRALVRERVAR